MGLQAGESITGKAFEKGEVIFLKTPAEVEAAMQDMRVANRTVLTRAIGSPIKPLSAIAAPISIGDQKFGVLVLEALKEPDSFAEEDIPFILSLADLIALAIERERLTTKADAIRATQETDRLRSELMATLSHELRMPLTAIRGYATALQLEDVQWSEEKQSEFLKLIDEECENMQVMLSDLLDSSLIDIHQITMQPQPMRLQYVANEVCNELQNRAEKHHVFVDLPADFPIVQADPHWVKQIFRNILDNAIKYSPEGGLILVRGEIRDSYAVISISDQGLGISPENLIPLFEKFYRVKSPDGFRIPGTGLGLPIARAITEAHGGRIWVESKVDEGTTVSFSLPFSSPILERLGSRSHE
jgi:K+-sensing histidine kinase KdpD